MTPSQAREKAEELVAEISADTWERQCGILARALLLAQAEAVEECAKTVAIADAPHAKKPLDPRDYVALLKSSAAALRRAAEEIK